MVHTSHRTSRRGVILLVVMALLSLFAAVGIGFVIYAESAATHAKYNREAYAPTTPDVDPEMMLNYFLCRFIYDDENLYSALRGHSLARSLYGWDPNGQNETPYSGTGKFRNNQQNLGALSVATGTPLDDYRMISYIYHPSDNFLRDPDCLTPRTSDQVAAGAYVRMSNVSYTAPDMNNVFLGMINSNGEVVKPSFFRQEAAFNSMVDPPGMEKYTVLYPLSSYHQFDKDGDGAITADERFPDPGPGGHVKQLDFSPGTINPLGGFHPNDSYWIPIGFPVLEAKDGRKYTALAAVLAIDLDGKVNLNAIGSLRQDMAGAYLSPSNKGIGPWEINPSRVFPAATLPATSDWPNLFANTTLGRYGSDGAPAATGATLGNPPGSLYLEPTPRPYAQIDADGYDSTTMSNTTALVMPTTFNAFPTYPTGYENGNAAELTNHPALYNPMNPANVGDRRFAVSQVEALLRYAGTGSPSLLSEWYRLCPQGFNDSANPTASRRARLSVTPESWDLGRPGRSPWLAAAPAYSMNAGSNMNRMPMGTAVAYTGAAGGEFGPDLAGITRAVERNPSSGQIAQLAGRLNINRVLPRIDEVGTNGRIANVTTFREALRARQAFAQDIFQLLCLVTMGQTGAGDDETREWLAQLAVNIVDYRDSDYYMTPFQWDSVNDKWVYGTELPELVINEVYSELGDERTTGNAPPNPGNGKGMGNGGNGKGKNVNTEANFWVELLNPLPRDPNRVDVLSGQQSAVRLQMPADGSDPQYAVYNLVITEGAGGANPFSDSATGAPPAANRVLEVTRFEPEPNPAPQPVLTQSELEIVQSIESASVQTNYAGATQKNEGLYVLGPVGDFHGTNANLATLRVKQQTIGGAVNAMSYAVGANDPTPQRHSLFLRRLACPHLPPESDPNNAAGNIYNPYITVDYVVNVKCHDGTTDTNNGKGAPVTAFANRSALGRKQPYAAEASQQRLQSPDTDVTTAGIQPYTDQPQHTFFRHNAVEASAPSAALVGQTLTLPFDWLVHLDRYLTSPVELLHVNCFRPYELTQYFITSAPITDATNATPIVITTATDHGLGTGAIVDIFGVQGNDAANGTWTITVTGPNTFSLDTSTGSGNYVDGGGWSPIKFLYHAPWLMNDTRLYRLFEYLDAGHRANGVSHDGRFPGKININTMDREAFLALCDPNTASNFPLTEVQAAFDRIAAARTDRPFRSLATGSFAMPGAGSAHPDVAGTPGIEHTLLRSRGGASRDQLLAVDHQPTTTTHWSTPALRNELLAKIFNNTTTRSNVFAVWVTIGFFEVLDDNARPVKLGPEIGAAQNRQIRHRMFAIVDRSQLRIKLQDAVNSQQEMNWTTPSITATSGPQQVDILAPSGGTPVIDMTSGLFQGQIKYKTMNGREWILQVGSTLILDANTVNEEAVTVTQVKDSPYAVTVVASRTHDTGTRGNIIVRGNMGPWSNPDYRYDMRKDTDVVRYFSVIK